MSCDKMKYSYCCSIFNVASGEPPLCMSFSVFFALRKCIEEARKEVGNTSYFNFSKYL